MVARASAGPRAALACAVALAGCHRRFACDDDVQCRLDGAQGFCEPNGSCSFLADECESGRRWGEHAAKDLAGDCVDPGLDTVADTGTSTAGTDGDSSAGPASTDQISAA